ncbi:MAG: ATP-binding protein [Stagnimonas sp.]|nr:ATP-binding protein [Stagnimonas sp.]
MAVKKNRERELGLWQTVAVVAVLAIGLLVFLSRMSLSVDQQQHQSRLAAIRAVNNLDVDLNRAFTQTLAGSGSTDSDGTKEINDKLGAALHELENGPYALRGFSPELDTALDAFMETVESKFRLGFEFQAGDSLLTQRLINNLNALLPYSDWVLRETPVEQRGTVGAVLKDLVNAVVNLAVVPTATNTETVKAGLARLAGYGGGAATPGYGKAVASMQTLIQSVITDKTDLVQKLRGFLNLPTGPQLEAVEQAYQAWYQGEIDATNSYRTILVVYTGALLLALAFLGFRLRQSYGALDQANAGLTHANRTLESQVQERTKDLRGALSELRESQAQLVQSEKMASLGQMVAGVAHEINTPLGYARGNARIVRNTLGEIRGLCESQGRALSLLNAANASEEEVAGAIAVAEAQRQELNPDELMGDLESLLLDADHGLVQIADLVSSLKDFSRVDRSRTDVFDLNAGIDSAIKICNNQLKNRVEVIREFGTLPEIECSPSQINQVFLNLINNAGQAIQGEGHITIRTAAEPGGVVVRVSDTGCGMSEEVKQRIFEPFFTTKPVGQGTGLGLSIVFRIIEEHGGRIAVDSTVGKGTTFSVHLPLLQPRLAEAEASNESGAASALAA